MILFKNAVPLVLLRHFLFLKNNLRPRKPPLVGKIDNPPQERTVEKDCLQCVPLKDEGFLVRKKVSIMLLCNSLKSLLGILTFCIEIGVEFVKIMLLFS